MPHQDARSGSFKTVWRHEMNAVPIAAWSECDIRKSVREGSLLTFAASRSKVGYGPKAPMTVWQFRAGILQTSG